MGPPPRAAAAAWRRSTPPTCPSRCAGRRAHGRRPSTSASIASYCPSLIGVVAADEFAQCGECFGAGGGGGGGRRHGSTHRSIPPTPPHPRRSRARHLPYDPGPPPQGRGWVPHQETDIMRISEFSFRTCTRRRATGGRARAPARRGQRARRPARRTRPCGRGAAPSARWAGRSERAPLVGRGPANEPCPTCP